MNCGCITNSPFPSVRVLAARELAVLAVDSQVFWFFLLSLAALIAESSYCYPDEDDEDVIAAPPARQFVLTEQQFDQMAFGGQQVLQHVNGGKVVQHTVAQTSVDFRRRMEATAIAEIEAINRRISLTEAQKKKLKLAARGDIAQLVSRADELRPKLTSKPLSQLQYVELMREMQPLQMSHQFGASGENSLFRKTLRNTLTEEQRLRWRILERERRKAIIETAIQTWERTANGIKLEGESRLKFIEVLLEYGDLPETRTNYIYYIVLVEAGKQEDRLKPFVPEEVWEKLQKQIFQARQVEASLRRSGQWPVRTTDDDVADSKSDGAKGR